MLDNVSLAFTDLSFFLENMPPISGLFSVVCYCFSKLINYKQNKDFCVRHHIVSATVATGSNNYSKLTKPVGLFSPSVEKAMNS
jgi:hypothetical protein